MPLNLRILLPIIVLAAMSAFSTVWLSYTSIRSAEARTASANVAMEFVSRSAEMSEKLRVARAELKRVLDMTRLMDVDEVGSTIETEIGVISNDLEWLLENTEDEKILAELAAAGLLLDEWLGDANILLGKTQSNEIPTTEKISRAEAALEKAFVRLAHEAQAKVERTSVASLQEMRATMMRTAVILFAGLSAVLIGSFLLARGLSRDVSGIALRLLNMADKKETRTDRNVLNSARGAVDALELALKERAELESQARKAETERLEVAEKEKIRAENERQRIAKESKAAEAQAEAQKRRAEQSAELEEDIARVVSAARNGDLNSRIDRSFEEPSLNDVSQGINALLETVASSISQAQETQRRLAKGDLTARFEGEQSGVFKSLQRDINQTAEQFQDAMHQISASSKAILDDAMGISSAAKSLASRTEQTAGNTDLTANTVERVSTAASQMATNAAESSNLVAESIQKVGSSDESMKKAMQTMDEIANYSKKISAVVDHINEISFQTNLLALNAGVEAARAGSAGSGFAVVASEVRALALRSSESAKEIETLIASSGERVDAGVQVVKQTGEALKVVASSVNEVSERVASIAEEAVSQSGELLKIQSSLTEIDQATQSNAAMFEETTAASESLTAAADSLANLSSQFEGNNPDDSTRLSA